MAHTHMHDYVCECTINSYFTCTGIYARFAIHTYMKVIITVCIIVCDIEVYYQ